MKNAGKTLNLLKNYPLYNDKYKFKKKNSPRITFLSENLQSVEEKIFFMDQITNHNNLKTLRPKIIRKEFKFHKILFRI